jgi:hypothetical protein
MCATNRGADVMNRPRSGIDEAQADDARDDERNAAHASRMRRLGE